jgi:hypothetical protein
MNGQLELFDEPNGKTTAAEVGLSKHVPRGAARLLAELVKRGLHEGDLRVAAAFCLALDERAGE